MTNTNNTFLTVPISFALNDKTDPCQAVARKTSLNSEDILHCKLHKRSVDARKKHDIRIVCSYVITVKHGAKPTNCTPYVEPRDILSNKECANKTNARIAVVGSGPSGLFAARLLQQNGFEVTIFERGSDIHLRQQKVQNFWSGNADLDENCNVQYGLGGAGTFSDGKLASGISSPLIYTVFNEFARCGAPQDILYSSTPHIGTDKLVDVVANMRDVLNSQGATIRFDCCVDNIVVHNGKLQLTCRNTVNGETDLQQFDEVVLAIGHSARDTYSMLVSNGFTVEPKPFAIGVRVEHSRQFISQAQYGALALTHRDLQSANYKLVADKLPSGRSCYSFCMCPGGEVVCSSSERYGVVVNGMSNYDRMADNSNSALVVNVNQADFYQGVLGGVTLQREIEQKCYNYTKNTKQYAAPAKNVVDFIKGKASTQLQMTSSYRNGLVPCNLWDILPRFICQALKEGLSVFGKKISGFDKCGILIAAETRTSSPVRILRDKQLLCSVDCPNLYPCGEGCGYAGGITSSAVDGLKVAMAICDKYGVSIDK